MDAVDDDARRAGTGPARGPPTRSPGLITIVTAFVGLALDPLDPAAQLARRPERVDQLEVVVGQQRREQRADGLQRAPARTGGPWAARLTLGHMAGTLPAENECHTFVPPSNGVLGSIRLRDESPTAGPRARAGRRDPDAVRRARDAGRPDRGDRATRSGSPAGSSTGSSPPRRSSSSSRSPTTSRSCAELTRAATDGQRATRRAARAADGGLRRVLPALPGVPRLLAGADAPARARSSTRSSPSRSGCGSARGWRAASGR